MIAQTRQRWYSTLARNLARSPRITSSKVP